MQTAKYSSNPGNKLKVVLHGKTCVSPPSILMKYSHIEKGNNSFKKGEIKML
jgi:hypothetical protein